MPRDFSYSGKKVEYGVLLPINIIESTGKRASTCYEDRYPLPMEKNGRKKWPIQCADPTRKLAGARDQTAHLAAYTKSMHAGPRERGCDVDSASHDVVVNKDKYARTSPNLSVSFPSDFFWITQAYIVIVNTFAMSDQEILFFDLPSRPPNKCWSLNPWKTRFVLNYKGIPYKTEWVEYPDIKPKFEGHLPPRDLYTIPTVVLPDGKWVTDSKEIARVLEEKYPEKPLHLDSPYIARLDTPTTGLFRAIAPVFIPGVPFNILNEASIPYFRRTREANIKTTLEKFQEGGGEKAWKAAQPHIEKIDALLKENTEGPFFEGKTVGFVDFQWGGILIFLQRLGDNAFEELLKHSSDPDLHLKFLEALKPWSERDDH
ncbi:hypothetical protein M426DRAFT_25733 [Hypoxylon sp. CI-4A]|nr:hypothetical protein M426DRAFT_25733 [Hypoxylon sp. CI-4A]